MKDFIEFDTKTAKKIESLQARIKQEKIKQKKAKEKHIMNQFNQLKSVVTEYKNFDDFVTFLTKNGLEDLADEWKTGK